MCIRDRCWWRLHHRRRRRNATRRTRQIECVRYCRVGTGGVQCGRVARLRPCVRRRRGLPLGRTRYCIRRHIPRLPVRKPLFQRIHPPPQPGNPHQRDHHAHRHCEQHQGHQHDYRFQRLSPSRHPADSSAAMLLGVRTKVGIAAHKRPTRRCTQDDLDGKADGSRTGCLRLAVKPAAQLAHAMGRTTRLGDTCGFTSTPHRACHRNERNAHKKTPD